MTPQIKDNIFIIFTHLNVSVIFVVFLNRSFTSIILNDKVAS